MGKKQQARRAALLAQRDALLAELAELDYELGMTRARLMGLVIVLDEDGRPIGFRRTQELQ